MKKRKKISRDERILKEIIGLSRPPGRAVREYWEWFFNEQDSEPSQWYIKKKNLQPPTPKMRMKDYD